MREIARLKGKEYPKLIGIAVTEEFHQRWAMLRKQHKIDTSEEARRVLNELLDRLKRDVERSA